MTTREIKLALYSLDTDYIAGVLSISDYTMQSEELFEALIASEKIDTLVRQWDKYTELMASNI